MERELKDALRNAPAYKFYYLLNYPESTMRMARIVRYISSYICQLPCAIQSVNNFISFPSFYASVNGTAFCRNVHWTFPLPTSLPPVVDISFYMRPFLLTLKLQLPVAWYSREFPAAGAITCSARVGQSLSFHLSVLHIIINFLNTMLQFCDSLNWFQLEGIDIVKHGMIFNQIIMNAHYKHY